MNFYLFGSELLTSLLRDALFLRPSFAKGREYGLAFGGLIFNLVYPNRTPQTRKVATYLIFPARKNRPKPTFVGNFGDEMEGDQTANLLEFVLGPSFW